MEQTKVLLFAILFSVLGQGWLHAQEAFAATGGNASGSGGSVSYTVGQVLYSTNTGSNGSEAQGVQQSFDIFVVTGQEEGNSVTLHYSVYPNPANEILILRIEGESQTQYVMYLYGVNGNLLEVKNTEGTETVIDLKDLVQATYFLKVTDNKEVLKTFKIIRN